jgi:hypothetical protein
MFSTKVISIGGWHYPLRLTDCLSGRVTKRKMDQLKNLADNRLINGCIYCGGPDETRDHVPSRVLLDAPFPENLPVVGACSTCNFGFSQDEEYFACLLESLIAGSTEPEHIRRSSVAKILRRAPALRARIEAAKTIVDGQIKFTVEQDRINNVFLKLARGHAAYELSQPCQEAPSTIWSRPLHLMTEEEIDSFDACHIVEMLGEIGSRGSQRAMVTMLNLESPNGEQQALGLIINDWIDVQEDRYRYLAIDDENGITIKIIVGEFLACEVTWAREVIT